MSSELHHYTRDEFLAEFYPDPADKAAIAAGMEQLRAEQRAFRLAEMRRRLGITQAQVAARMGITQGRVSAIEHAKPGTTELRTLAAYVEALGGRLEIIADFGDQRLAFTGAMSMLVGGLLAEPVPCERPTRRHSPRNVSLHVTPKDRRCMHLHRRRRREECQRRHDRHD